MDIQHYIDKKAADFAKPILTHLRSLVHRYCPEVEETLRWGMPSFSYRKKILCQMASFKSHVTFGFWLESVMEDEAGILTGGAMGSLGRITSLSDLPADEALGKLIQQAMELINAGVTLKRNSADDEAISIPLVLLEELEREPQLLENFRSLTRSQQKEYATWIENAKTATTKTKRVQETLTNVAEKKPKDWRYMDRYK